MITELDIAKVINKGGSSSQKNTAKFEALLTPSSFFK